MRFKAKRDMAFAAMMIVSISVIALACLVPSYFAIYYEPEPEWLAVIILVGLFILCTGFMIWIWMDIEYVLLEDYLYVRGGPFRSKIPYDQITRMFESNNMLIGYRVLSSKDALEIQYKTGLMGSIIISPENKQEFMEELRKRCKLL